MITLMSLVPVECGTHFYILVIIQNLISVLDGNFEKWKSEKCSTSKQINKINRSNYIANENVKLVLDKDQINKNIISKKFQLIDARR